MMSDDLEGVYEVAETFYKELPPFSWYDIFTFSNLNPLTGQKWTKSGLLKKPIGLNDDFTSRNF